MVSLIITIKNELHALPEWLESIKKQTVQPDEIVIVDGGSIDGTWEWLQHIQLPHVSIFKDAGNIGFGRNKAIGYAKGDVIVVTDAGCIYEDHWFSRMVEPLKQNKADFITSAFGPWFQSDDTFLTYGIASVTIPRVQEFHRSKWLASSRSVAFHRDVWNKVGGYPEWIPYCEDIIFDMKIAKAGYKELYLKEPLVFWRPRTTLVGYLRQVYNYTRSDGHGKLFNGRQITRYLVYTAFFLIVFSAFFDVRALAIPFILAPQYVGKYWSRWFSFTEKKTFFFRLAGLFFVPFLIFLGDMAKMWGWMKGVKERRSQQIIFESW